MVETRKLAAILVADVVGYSRLAGSDEDRILARLRALRSDLIDPIIAVHNGRVVKRTGDGAIVEFRSVVDAVRCAIEVQTGMVERNAGLPPERRIEFRMGIHLGDVVEENDGDLMGDGVNIAARLEGIAKPGSICLSDDAYRQVKSRLDLAVSDMGLTQLKNIAEPVRVYSLEVGKPTQAKPVEPIKPLMRKKGPTLAPIIAGVVVLIAIAALGAWYLRAGQNLTVVENAPAHLSIVVLPFRNLSGDPSQDYFADGITENLTTGLSRIRNSFVIAHNTALLVDAVFEKLYEEMIAFDLARAETVMQLIIDRDEAAVPTFRDLLQDIATSDLPKTDQSRCHGASPTQHLQELGVPSLSSSFTAHKGGILGFSSGGTLERSEASHLNPVVSFRSWPAS